MKTTQQIVSAIKARMAYINKHGFPGSISDAGAYCELARLLEWIRKPKAKK